MNTIKIQILFSIVTTILMILFSFHPINTAEEITTTVFIHPQIMTVKQAENFTINITCNPTEPIEGYEFDLIFDATYLKVNTVEQGTIFQNYSTWFSAGTIDNFKGYIDNIYSLITGPGNTSKSGTLAMISFTAFSTNVTTFIQLNDTGISNDSGYIPISIQPGEITIGDPSDTNDTHHSEDPPKTSNTPPALPERPSGPQDCLINTVYNFSTRALDSENDELYYIFDWDDNSKYEILGSLSSGSICMATHQWTKTGMYNITVQAKDIHGKQSGWSPHLTIIVRNQSTNNSHQQNTPSASFSYSPQDPQVNETIQFKDTSTHPNGTIIKWKWDFGDGYISEKQHPTHQYDQSNEYRVTLTVWDDTNVNNITSSQLKIESKEQLSDQDETPALSFGLIMSILSILLLIKYINKYKN